MVCHSLRRVLATLALCCAGIGAAFAADEPYHYSVASLPLQRTWMATLDDGTPFARLTVPGTWASAGLLNATNDKAQTLSLLQQLDAGVRYLHLGVRGEGNDVILSHKGVSQKRRFVDAIGDVAKFLALNPSEVVFVHPYRDDGVISGGRMLHELMQPYATQFAAMSVPQPVKAYTPLGSMRGKIVWLNETNVWMPGYDLLHARRQDNAFIDTHWSLYAKWEQVRAHFDAANKRADFVPYLNNLAASGGAETFFVASGRVKPTEAPRRSTNQMRPFSNPFPDFPAWRCLLPNFLCEVTYEGMNVLASQRLDNPGVHYAGFVIAAFPGDGLIARTIDINRTERTFINATFGHCINVDGGLFRGARVTASGCHGAPNQRVTVRNGQLKIGGQCVDQEAATFNGRVLLWPCHGGANQQWIVDAAGRIRSAMWGGNYCLTQTGRYAPLRLASCQAGSKDQTFVAQM